MHSYSWIVGSIIANTPPIGFEPGDMLSGVADQIGTIFGGIMSSGIGVGLGLYVVVVGVVYLKRLSGAREAQEAAVESKAKAKKDKAWEKEKAGYERQAESKRARREDSYLAGWLGEVERRKRDRW